MEKARRYLNISISLGALALAGGGFWWLVATKPQPKPQNTATSVPQVQVLAVQPVVFEAPIVGYGTIRPKRQVKIIPEVGGRLLKVHEALAVGNLIAKDELLFEIDGRVYESRVRQVEADIRRLETQLRLHERNKVSLEQRLALAKQQETLAGTNLERDQTLRKEGAGVTDPELELAQDRYLRQADAVLAYESQLAMIPLEVEETTASLETKRAQLEEAELSVEKTRILCPFDARVDAVTAQQSQVVIASFQIAALTDMEALELAAGVDPRELRWTNLRAFARAVGQDWGAAPEAAITWSLHDREYVWRGPVTRLERLDETTRTAQVVVEIRDVMRGLHLESGQANPPLSIGMFCKVEIPAEPLLNALVIPRSAVYDGDGRDEPKFVYVFEADGNRGGSEEGRLGVRRVPVLRTVGDQVLVDFDRDSSAAAGDPNAAPAVCELRAGEEIVVSPLPRAVAGMPIRRQAESSLARSSGACPREVLASAGRGGPRQERGTGL